MKKQATLEKIAAQMETKAKSVKKVASEKPLPLNKSKWPKVQ